MTVTEGASVSYAVHPGSDPPDISCFFFVFLPTSTVYISGPVLVAILPGVLFVVMCQDFLFNRKVALLDMWLNRLFCTSLCRFGLRRSVQNLRFLPGNSIAGCLASSCMNSVSVDKEEAVHRLNGLRKVLTNFAANPFVAGW